MPRLLVCCALALLFVSGAAARDEGLDCKLCHVCEHPTASEPCLEREVCPRHQADDGLAAGLGPDVVILDDLEDLYVPVRFNHAAHAGMVGMSGGCETCHHYTPASSPHPGCAGCHPADIQHEDLSQPGLKGAYHRQCLSCHSEWDTDTRCEICHEKKLGGRLGGMASEVCEHSHYEPIPLNELILFKTDYAAGDVVPFHHENHSTRYELNCSVCHKEQSCARCHVQGGELHPMGALADINLHDTCYQCHGENDCEECHGRSATDLFEHRSTGWPLKSYHSELHCRQCHGTGLKYEAPKTACDTCHPADWGPGFNHALTGVRLDATHGELECSDCHAAAFGIRPDCSACHDDGRSYNRAVGFGAP